MIVFMPWLPHWKVNRESAADFWCAWPGRYVSTTDTLDGLAQLLKVDHVFGTPPPDLMRRAWRLERVA